MDALNFLKKHRKATVFQEETRLDFSGVDRHRFPDSGSSVEVEISAALKVGYV